MQAEASLEQLFDRLRAALAAGDLAVLSALGPELEAAVPPAADDGTLRRLRRQAEVNATLLRAALQGVRAARRRLEEVTGRAGQSVYDASGRLDALSASSAAPLRRA